LARAEISVAASLFQRESTPLAEAALVRLERADALLERRASAPPGLSRLSPGFGAIFRRGDAIPTAILVALVRECARLTVDSLGYNELRRLVGHRSIGGWLNSLEEAGLIRRTRSSLPSQRRVGPTAAGVEAAKELEGG
jgi:hypothetical protein